jgi:thioredoxin-like negative regulator of GroEL
VDGDRRLDVVRRFGIREFPSLVLIVRRRVVARLEGKATGSEIDRLLRTHLPA